MLCLPASNGGNEVAAGRACIHLGICGQQELEPVARNLIAAADEVHISAASIWEIAIKARLSKIQGEPAAFADAIAGSGFLGLPVPAHHGAAVANLPLYHTDPFDRLLVAPAIAEPLRFLTPTQR